MGHWKGAAGELEVIAKLQPWWRQVEPEAMFYRTPMSGGWAKTRKVPPGFKGHGDVMTDPGTCRKFPFSVEVKWRKSISEAGIANFLAGKETTLWKYWDQCVRDAKLNGQCPMMWFRGANVGNGRGRRMPWRVVVETEPGRMFCWLEEHFLQMDPATFLRW